MQVKNTSIYMGEDIRSGRHQEEQADRGQKNRKSIYAGDLNKQEDIIVKKRREAQQKAMKIVGDAFEGERKLDAEQETRRENVTDLTGQIAQAKSELASLDAEAHPEDAEAVEDYNKRIQELEMERMIENTTIANTKVERLKTNPILKATSAAEAVMEAASDEIVGMLMEEAKEHIDEEMKEKEEQAEKAAEKKAEQEEKLEEAKSEAAEEEVTKEIISQPNQEEIKKEVENIIDKMKLIEEDIKGAAVDTQI